MPIRQSKIQLSFSFILKSIGWLIAIHNPRSRIAISIRDDIIDVLFIFSLNSRTKIPAEPKQIPEIIGIILYIRFINLLILPMNTLKNSIVYFSRFFWNCLMPRYGLYNDKNPLAMSFLLTAKGLVFTISQQMLQASQPQKKRWKNEQNILRNDIKAYRRNSVPNWKPLTKKPKNYGLNKSKKALKRISQKRCI